MPSNYVLLNRLQLTSSASSITFNSIPQSGYTDLKIVMSARHDGAQVANAFYIKFNGSSTSQTAKFIEGAGSGSPVSGSNNNPYGGVDVGASATSNTFNNCEIYIPNYASSNYKSYLSDSISENNATTAYTWLTSGLWSNTSPITSVSIMPDTTGKNYIAGSTFSLYGIAAVGSTPLIAPYAAGGDSVTNDGTYWYHTFLSSSKFTPLKPLTCDYLVIAGGGGGGNNWGGGGGAGGVLSFSSQSATKNTNYSVVVGAGGAGSIPTSGSNGSNSQFGSLTASVGGGLGGSQAIGNNGGSGGGGSGAGYTSSYAGGSPTSGQGNSGGTSVYSGQVSIGGGGGGGAGGAGGNGGYFSGGSGGSPTSSYSTWASVTSTGVSGAYAGGGGGGSASSAGSATGGGAGNGANQGVAGTSAITNTGSGGGGGGSNSGPGGSGASGIVIVRYAI